jgi:chromosomal replication initiator protein
MAIAARSLDGNMQDYIGGKNNMVASKLSLLQVDAESAWLRVQSRLRDDLGETTFRSWLKPLRILAIQDGAVQMAAPTRFMREWVASHYAEDLRRGWQTEIPTLEAVEIVVRRMPEEEAAATAASAPRKVENAGGDSRLSYVTSTISDDEILSISSQIDPRLTFENFVVGKPNELAYAAAMRVAETDTVAQGCNPLFLYGGVGLGKTHLMHAMAWHIRQRNPQRRVVYLSAEKFMYQFIRALRNKEAFAFKELFRSVDVLMIDDVQFIAGKDSTQEEFFHTFNALVDQNKQLVITGDRSPADMEGMEERIRSRLGWGLVADIHSTTYELRLGILQSKLDQMQGIHIPPKVLEFLAYKITSNVRELEGALNRVVAHATLVGRAITLESTQEVLADLLRANDRRITIEDIQKQVAQHFNIKMADMHSARRSRTIARPRQIAMYLAKKLTSRSLPEIGRKFGGKDHTTVMHAVRKIEELQQQDSSIAEDVTLLMRLLRG